MEPIEKFGLQSPKEHTDADWSFIYPSGKRKEFVGYQE